MNKKYILLTILCSVLLTIFLNIVLPEDKVYGEQSLDVEITLKTEKDITIKLYYLLGDQEEFSGERMLSREIAASEEFQTVNFPLVAKDVYGIRLDLGQTPGYVDIASVEWFDGLKSNMITADKLDKFEKIGIERAEINKDVLTVYSTQENPYIYQKSLMNFTMDKSQNWRWLYTILIFAGSFILIYVLLYTFSDFIKDLWSARKQIVRLSMNDFSNRYSGSYLGRIWGVIQPLTTILLFWFVFQVGLRSNAIKNVPFILWLIAAMIPWNFFSDAWLSGNGAFLSYSYIVKKLVFNIEILPMVKILASTFLNVIFNLLIIIVYTLYGRFPGIHMVKFLPLFFPLKKRC